MSASEAGTLVVAEGEGPSVGSSGLVRREAS